MSRKKSIGWILTIILIFNLLPINIIKVKAVDNVDIISNTEISIDSAKRWARNRNASEEFIGLADLFWKYAPSNGGVNPALAYVQAALETGYGKFPGVIDASFHNTCGLKITAGGDNYDPEAHQRFNSWDEGVQAHLDHLALYAGANGYPRKSTYDPRHFPYIKGKATTALSLSNNWAGDGYGDKLMTLYNSLLDYHMISTPLGCIDSPTNGSTINGNTVHIKGWFISYDGIDSLNVLVDGKFYKNITLNTERSDVQNAYPNYLNSLNSGFEYDLDVSGLSNGNRVITIQSIKDAKVLTSRSTTVKINRLESKMCIDKPSVNQSISNDNLTVEGWALSSSGVNKIEVYIDNQLKATTNTSIRRDDVQKVYPEYNSQNSGFSTNVDISSLTGGLKTLKVVQINNDGSTLSRSTTFNVNKLKSIGSIDIPSVNSKVGTYSLDISGWALSSSKVKKVEIYVDNVLKGNATIGISREDVKKVYPKYSYASTSGYKATIDVSGLSSGVKNLLVKATDEKGLTFDLSSTFVLENPIPRMSIDSPSINSSVSANTLTVKGWALNSSGVKNVEVYLNGKLMGSTKTGLEREDVKKVYPMYKDANKSGYSTNIDISTVSGGTKVLTVKQIGKDGSVQSSSIQINIKKLESKQYIDSPVSNQSVYGNMVNVRGWSIGNFKIKELKIYVDNKLLTTTNVGVSREDVKKAYPQYSYASTSGFDVNVDITGISSGKKELKVVQVDVNGNEFVTTTDIIVEKLNPLVEIDSPAVNEKVNTDSIKVSGWALNQSGINKINIYVNDTLISTTNTGLIREDVYKVYPKYADKNSGYSKVIDISKFSSGSLKIKVEQIGNNGSVCSKELAITKEIKIPRMCLDSPLNLALENSDTLTVKGWALNSYGIKDISIYIDGTIIKSMKPNEVREDVNKAYPGYTDGANSGFNTTINLKSLNKGKHILRVVATGNNNLSIEKSVNFYYKSSGKTIVVDPGHNYGGDEGAIGYIDGVAYYERDLNMKVSLYLKGYLEDYGYNVILTRQASDRDKVDVNTSLNNRVNIANNANADVFISIHHNSFESSSANGCEVFYYKDTVNTSKMITSKTLATNSVNNITKSTGFYNRGAKENTTYRVLKGTTMPGILVEGGFMSNPNELLSLLNDMTQRKIAKGVADAVKSQF